MTAPFDMRAAQVTGPNTAAKARVIWQDGILYAFDRSGELLFKDVTPEPKKSNVYYSRWNAGPYRLKRKCQSCGGFLRLSLKSASRVLADIGVK